MIKSKFILLMIAAIMVAGPFAVANTDEWSEDLDEIEEMQLAPSYTSQEKSAILGKKGEKLIDIQSSSVSARVDELSRRIGFLEKQNRLQEEQIRRLDRSVNDLKRRR